MAGIGTKPVARLHGRLPDRFFGQPEIRSSRPASTTRHHRSIAAIRNPAAHDSCVVGVERQTGIRPPRIGQRRAIDPCAVVLTATLHGVVFAIFAFRPSGARLNPIPGRFRSKTPGFCDGLPGIPRQPRKSRVLAPPGLW